jgi:transcriptional regulator with XRE-family HTH domain
MRLRPLAEEKARELGAKTDEEIAGLLGISKATLHRWRKGTRDVELLKARHAADALGLTVDTTFERVTPR